MSRPHAERLRAALASTPMFESLPAPLRERLQQMATLQALEKGDVLWRAGEPADSLPVIGSGRAKVVRPADPGDGNAERCSAGAPQDVVAIYNEIPYPAT